MSQAEKPHTPIPTRRALLRSLAVVTAGGAAAMAGTQAVLATSAPAAPAPGLAAAPEADPIFEMIKQHQRAVRAQKRAHKRFQKYSDDETAGPMQIIVGEEPEIKLKNEVVDGLWTRHEYLTGNMVPIFAHTKNQIEHYAPKDLSEDQRTEWVRQKYAKMLRDYRNREAKFKKSQRSVTYDAWNAKCDAMVAASKRLIETQPTTLAGISAVLAYWAKVADEDECDRDFISTVEFLVSTAENVRSLIGEVQS